MGPYRNPLEQRSSRSPARQYVSDSHDHKPDARGDAIAPLDPAAVNPAIDELIAAQKRLGEKLREALQGIQQGQPISVALTLAEAVKIAQQIHGLASAVHRGIAARLKLEARA